jgi:hypothetical protein
MAIICAEGSEFLPPSLTELGGKAISFEDGVKFPSSLTRITRTVSSRVIQLISKLRNFLSFVSWVPLSFDDILQLPTSLTHLECSVNGKGPFKEVLRTLPPHLEVLSVTGIADWTGVLASDFPRTLRRLSIGSGKFLGNDLRGLPESLLFLKLKGYDPDGEVFFPPSLSHLEFSASVFSWLGCFHVGTHLVKWDALPIPPRMTEERANKFFGILPVSLTDLSLRLPPYQAMGSAAYPIFLRWLSQLNYLNTLSLKDGNVDPKDFSVLPRSLTTLYCDSEENTWGFLLPEHLDGLPPFLKRVRLNFCLDWSTLVKRFVVPLAQKMNFKFPPLLEEDAISAIKFLLGCDQISEEDKKGIALYNSLFQFPLYTIVQPGSQGYSSLLRLVPNWLVHLPRSIVELSSTLPLKGEHLKDVPPCLRSATGNVHHITKAHIRALPRTLKYPLYIVSTDPNSKEEIEEDDFPTCLVDATRIKWGIFVLRKKLSQYHSHNNMPIIAPDPRVRIVPPKI